MKIYLFKLSFPAGLSLGDGRLSDSSIKLFADTLFSALCIESLGKRGSLQNFVDLAKNGDLKLSDAFPYIGDELYAPKPLIRVKPKNEEETIIYLIIPIMESKMDGTYLYYTRDNQKTV